MKTLSQFIIENLGMSINEANFTKTHVQQSEYALNALESVRDKFTDDEWYIIEGLTTHEETLNTPVLFPFLIMTPDAVAKNDAYKVISLHVDVEAKQSSKVQSEFKKIGRKAKKDGICSLYEAYLKKNYEDESTNHVQLDIYSITVDNMVEPLKECIAVLKKFNLV